MADIRINALTSTAGTTASDDYLAVDGSANGTRKLSAYSPVFGGNLTVNGTGTSSFSGSISASGGGADGTYGTVLYLAPSGFTTYRHAISTSASAGGPTFNLLKFSLANGASTTTDVLTLIGNGNATLAGNFTSGLASVTVAGASSAYTTYSANSVGSVFIGQSGGADQLATGAASGDAVFRSVQKIFLSTGGATPALTLDTSGNQTTRGNLTVSGGTLLFNQATAQYQTFNVNSGGTGDQVEIKYQQVGNGRAGIYFGTAVGGSGYMRMQVGSGGGTTALLANSTGNVLIGTAVDSGALLQIGTNTTTAAGGMVFGTDTALYRTAAADLSLDGIGGADAVLRFKRSGVEALKLESNIGSAYITAQSTLYLRSANTIALTLDGTQRALFASDIILTMSSRPPMIYSGGSTLYFGTNAGTLALTLDGSQNATFANGVKAQNFDLSNNGTGYVRFSNGIQLNMGMTANGVWKLVDASAGRDVFNYNNAANTLTTASATKIGSTAGTVDSRLHVYESTTVSDSNGLTLEQASTGDSLISFLLTGVQRWSVGIDNSDSDKFKIGTGSLGTADKFTVDTNGDTSLAGTIATQGGTASTPANAFATGTAGTIRWDASYIYVCTAANTWKRAAIAAW